MHIVLKTNRMVGLLKRTCPLITDVEVRRTLYLSLVKSQLSYATDQVVVSRKCQIDIDPRKSPEVCNSLDTQN